MRQTRRSFSLGPPSPWFRRSTAADANVRRGSAQMCGTRDDIRHETCATVRGCVSTYTVHTHELKGIEMGWDNAQDKFIWEGLIVQEDPRVIMIPVEPIIHCTYHVHGTLDVLIARKHDECRILALAPWRVGAYQDDTVFECPRSS
jgi:hypothetical protein